MSISGKNQVRNQASNVWFDLKIPFYDIILLVSYPDYFLLCNKKLRKECNLLEMSIG